MARMKPYVGCKAGKWTVFKSFVVPTDKTHGDLYNAVIGPFRTVRGANFMRDYGQGNPHCRNVAEAERLAKLESEGKLR